MKRLLVFIAAIFAASFMANAQWRIDSFERGDQMIQYREVLETENSVLVYASLDFQAEKNHWLYVTRQAYIKSEGLKYKIKNSVNIPLRDDADKRWAHFPEGKHAECNFVLEFEKFPVKSGFDILCEPDNPDGDFSFNARNVQVSEIGPEDVIDTERFLDSAAPLIYGQYANNGTTFAYYIREGVCLTYHVGLVDDGWFDQNPLFYIDIVNNSDHGIMFEFDKVYALAVKNKKNGTTVKTPVAKFNPDSFDQFLRDLDYQDAVYNTSGGLNEVSSMLYREGTNAPSGSWERVGWRALEALAKQEIDNRAQEYLKTHPVEHPKALKTHSIKSGEALHGYVATKKKNVDEIWLIVPLDGFEYTLKFALPK